jgi:hypothetical protein
MSIYPSYIPPFERRKKGRRAELLVYDCLAKLGSKWTILYHRSIKRETNYGISDREADFIIAHPDLGVLVLEVKGGGIVREAGDWCTIPLKELRKPPEQRWSAKLKQSPYDQATDTAKHFERKLDKILYDKNLPRRTFAINVAVCFPDVEISADFFLGMEAPRSITIDRNGLDDIQQRLYDIFQVYRKGSAKKPGEAGIKVLVDFLAPTWEIDTSIAYQFEDAEKHRKELTDEQFDWLYFCLEDNPRSLVSGCAGSGKTVLATLAAQKLADEGKSVLLVCYNRNLGNFLATRSGQHSRILPGTFHQLCYELAAGVLDVDLPSWSEELSADEESFFWEQAPDALLMAAIEDDIRFDAIIVDEGQDFRPKALEALEQLLRDQRSHFHIFYDDNQRIYTRKRIPFDWPIFPLTKNLRNTDPIHKQVIKYYYNPARNRSSGVPGPEPLLIDVQSHDGEADAVRYALETLEAEGVPPEWIVILTPRSQENSAWRPKETRWGKYSPVWGLQKTFGKQINCCTIHGFKGLERPVVVLTELDHLHPDQCDLLLYVALSRAKTHLVVVGNLPE